MLVELHSRAVAFQGVALRRKKAGRSILLAIAALLATILNATPDDALPSRLDALPPGIELLYSSGQYRQAAVALQTEAERNPKDAPLYFWLAAAF